MAKAQAPSIEIARLKNNFYRDHFKRVGFLFILMVFVITCLVGIILYIETHQPQPKYFALEAEGNLVPRIGLDQPNQSDALVLQWANTATIGSFNLNYIGYQQSLAALSSYFTSTGWQNYLQQLQQSGNLDTMKQQKMIMRAEATGAPTILEKGVISNHYAWQIRLPIEVTLESSQGQPIHQFLTVTLLITRVPVSDTTPKGIAIIQYVTTNTPI